MQQVLEVQRLEWTKVFRGVCCGGHREGRWFTENIEHARQFSDQALYACELGGNAIVISSFEWAGDMESEEAYLDGVLDEAGVSIAVLPGLEAGEHTSYYVQSSSVRTCDWQLLDGCEDEVL